MEADPQHHTDVQEGSTTQQAFDHADISRHASEAESMETPQRKEALKNVEEGSIEHPEAQETKTPGAISKRSEPSPTNKSDGQSSTTKSDNPIKEDKEGKDGLSSVVWVVGAISFLSIIVYLNWKKIATADIKMQLSPNITAPNAKRTLIALSRREITCESDKINTAAEKLSDQIVEDIKWKNKQFDDTDIDCIRQEIKAFILFQGNGEFQINTDETHSALGQLSLKIDMEQINNDFTIIAELFTKNSSKRGINLQQVQGKPLGDTSPDAAPIQTLNRTETIPRT